MKWVLVCIGAALVVAAALFAFTRWELNRLEDRYPPVGKWVLLYGLKLHFVEAGTGPAVVLLHGASTNLRDFTASIVEPLSRHCRVVAFDRPGHGYSTYPLKHWMNPREQAEAIRLALWELGIERSVWVGHSWAGSVVMAGLLEFPDEVTGGVLLGGAAYPWEGGVDWTNHIVDVPVAGTLFKQTLLIPAGTLLMNRQIGAAFVPNEPPPDYRQRTAIDLVLRPSQFTVNGRDVRLLSDFLEAQSRYYPAIRQPLLMIHGGKDDIVPAWNHADRLIKVVPRAKLITLSGTGHAPHHVRTEDVVRQVAEFACKSQVGSAQKKEPAGSDAPVR